MPKWSHTKSGETEEGGHFVFLTNKTGAASVKGTMVRSSSTTEYAVETAAADEENIVGVLYENGIADGDECVVVVSGMVDVLLQDLLGSTVGYWARTSVTQAGRADISSAVPPGGGIPQADEHFREIGHCFQTVVGGADQLCRILLHLN